jgi:hypothetical protein
VAAPNSTYDDIVTTTIKNRSRELADNVTNNNAILSELSRQGNIKTFSGGDQILQELEYAENAAFTRYSGYEVLNIQPTNTFTAAAFDIKQYAVAVSISGLEMLQNSSREQMIDLIDARVGNAERTMSNRIATDLFSNGTADSGKQIGGLQAAVPDTATSGTYGGIDRAVWDFWQSVSFDSTSDLGAAASAANIQTQMNTVFNALCRNNDKPNLILADTNYFAFYQASLQNIQRITSERLGNLGFVTLEYQGVPVVLCGGVQGSGDGCPDDHMYFLNTNYLHYRPHAARNMVPLDPDRFAVNQDAMIKLIAWAGNLTVSNSSLQGVLKD